MQDLAHLFAALTTIKRAVQITLLCYTTGAGFGALYDTIICSSLTIIEVKFLTFMS